MKEQLTDTVGKHLESLIAMLMMWQKELGAFGVGNHVQVGDKKYFYHFIVAREDHPSYTQLIENYTEVKHGDDSDDESTD